MPAAAGVSDLYEDVSPISHRDVLIPTEANPDKATDIKELAAGYGIELGRTQRDAFVHYYRLLVEWNSRVRLVGNTNLEEIRDKFFLDSLVTGHTIGLGKGTASLVDVGSGAGFPGVPIAIAWPEVAVTLVESVGKKSRFLNTLAQELNLPNVEILCERAETLARLPEYREQYDFALARAVGNLGVTAEICLPFVKVGGIAATTKRTDQEAEVESSRPIVEMLGGEFEEPVEIDVPGFPGRRRYLLIEKLRPTPTRFPRRASRLGQRVN